jgi:flagella basal body P-ring formation protein FlgA
MDEKNMNKTCSQPKVVSIQTLPLHNREVSINRNTTCSSLRGMFPLGIETVLDRAFLIPFQAIFYLNSVFQTSYV